MQELKNLFNFIKASPTCFHNVEHVRQQLLKQSFTELYENDSWDLQEGKYFVARDNASIICFKVVKGANGFNVVASHNDSPTYKLKPSYDMVVNGYKKLNTEPYGGMLATTWFDKALSIAGRVMVQTEEGIKSVLVNLEDLNIVIPSLAIHLTRSAGPQDLTNPQNDLLPIIGLDGSNVSLQEMLEKKVNGKILSHDLFLYNKEEGKVAGLDNELIICPKLDDLECAYTSLEAFLNVSNNDKINICAIFDNEEVGSGSNHGAASTFLTDVLERICVSLNKDLKVMYANTMLVSADNAHAMHPAHPEKSDPTNNVKLNKGVVIKYHSGLSYTTEAISSSIFKSLCEKANVLVQDYTNRSDLRGGSTLGHIQLSKLSVTSVDIGLPQLAMHSSNETAGAKDVKYMIDALKAFYQSNVIVKGNDITL